MTFWTNIPQNTEFNSEWNSDRKYQEIDTYRFSNNGTYIYTSVEKYMDNDEQKYDYEDIGTYKIRFKNTKPTSKVLSYVSSNQINNQCYKDGPDLIVEVVDVPTNEQLTIICSGQDIEIDAIRIISDDIISIVSDLPIKTTVKQSVKVKK